MDPKNKDDQRSVIEPNYKYDSDGGNKEQDGVRVQTIGESSEMGKYFRFEEVGSTLEEAEAHCEESGLPYTIVED